MARVLDVTASMQGSLVFQEPVSLRISGRFEGTLETKGDLTIGERAVVSAKITGESITIAGQVTGQVVAHRLLKVIPPAVLKGEVWTPKLQVEPGAILEAHIHMTAQDRTLTLQEVAEYLEVEVHLLEEWVRRGTIPATQEGGEWRFIKEKIDEWVAAQKSS